MDLQEIFAVDQILHMANVDLTITQVTKRTLLAYLDKGFIAGAPEQIKIQDMVFNVRCLSNKTLLMELESDVQ